MSNAIEIRRTRDFDTWLLRIRDPVGVAVITSRIDRMAKGQFGDVRSVGDGVQEARIFAGPDYSLYFVRRGAALIVLLCGGDKGSQTRDIARAKLLARTLEL